MYRESVHPYLSASAILFYFVGSVKVYFQNFKVYAPLRRAIAQIVGRDDNVMKTRHKCDALKDPLNMVCGYDQRDFYSTVMLMRRKMIHFSKSKCLSRAVW